MTYIVILIPLLCLLVLRLQSPTYKAYEEFVEGLKQVDSIASEAVVESLQQAASSIDGLVCLFEEVCGIV